MKGQPFNEAKTIKLCQSALISSHTRRGVKFELNVQYKKQLPIWRSQNSFSGSFETVKNNLLKMLGYKPEIKLSTSSTADLPVAKMIPQAQRQDQFNGQCIYREKEEEVWCKILTCKSAIGCRSPPNFQTV